MQCDLGKDEPLSPEGFDRVILGGAVPTAGPLALPVPAELRAEHFLDRRELGIINVGPDAVVTVDGTEHQIRTKGCLYVGRGAKDISFAAPGRFSPRATRRASPRSPRSSAGWSTPSLTSPIRRRSRRWSGAATS